MPDTGAGAEARAETVQKSGVARGVVEMILYSCDELSGEDGYFYVIGGVEMARGKPTPTAKREQVKALLYLNPDLSSKDIAKETGVPDRTVRDILRAATEDDDAFAEYRQAKKREQIVNALDIASKYIDHLADPLVIAAAKARDSATVAGIMIDKAQLLAGEPTEIVQSAKPLPDLVKETKSIVKELEHLAG